MVKYICQIKKICYNRYGENMKKKLKLKKQVWVILIILLFLLIGIYAFKNIYQDIQYKKTNEYKLLQVGF